MVIQTIGAPPARRFGSLALPGPSPVSGGPAKRRPQSGRRLAWSFVLAALLTAACDSAPPPPAPTARSDSAGIEVVVANAPAWGPGEGWTVDPDPVVEIGVLRGDPDYEFVDLIAATRLGSGDIVVADHGASELRAYDAEGRFLWRAGRAGEGPGEFGSLDYVGALPGDTLITYDNALARVQLFDAAGSLVRVQRVALADDEGSGTAVADKVVGIADGLLVVRFIEYGDVMPEGVVRWPAERLATLDPADGSVRSLMVLPGHEANVTIREGGRYGHGAVHFGRGPQYAAAAGRLAIIDTEAWSVRLFSPLGELEAIVRRDVAPREPTGEDFEQELDGLAGLATGAEPSQVADLVRMWRGWPQASLLPLLRSVHLDASGNIWIQPFYLTGVEPPPLEVHAPDGTWLGSVALPPGLARGWVPYQAPYLEIGDDYVLGVWLDELEVHYVRMYRIGK